MTEMKRVSAEEAQKEDPYAWAAETPEPEPEDRTRRQLDPTVARAHALALADKMTQVASLAEDADYYTSGIIQDMEEKLDPYLLVRTVENVQRARADLARLEADLARALGRQARETPALKTGTDAGAGFTWEVRGGVTRKSWDHDAWKRDVRAAIVGGLELDGLVVLNPETGEEVPLSLKKTVLEAITMAQDIHGSAAPKKTAMKPLGLDVADYAETFPGPFTITITPDADASDTTGEDTTPDA